MQPLESMYPNKTINSNTNLENKTFTTYNQIKPTPPQPQPNTTSTDGSATRRKTAIPTRENRHDKAAQEHVKEAWCFYASA